MWSGTKREENLDRWVKSKSKYMRNDEWIQYDYWTIKDSFCHPNLVITPTLMLTLKST